MRYLLILVNGILIGAFDRAKFAATTLPRQYEGTYSGNQWILLAEAQF